MYMCSWQMAGLQRRVSELEEAQCVERDAQCQREVSIQQSQQCQQEKIACLEAALQEEQVQVRELNVELSLAQGRVQGLEEQLAKTDSTRADLEHKLSGLTSALRRTLGIGRGARSPTPRPRGRNPSPWRTQSPLKGSAQFNTSSFKNRKYKYTDTTLCKNTKSILKIITNRNVVVFMQISVKHFHLSFSYYIIEHFILYLEQMLTVMLQYLFGSQKPKL